MPPRCLLFGITLTLGLLSSLRAGEDSPAREQVEFFEQKIRPLLVAKCYECHSEGKKIKGGLKLDTRAGWQAGGDTGPAIVPGKPDESLLIRAVRYGDADLQMPPGGKLSPEEIARLEDWVKRGAPDPRVDPATSKTASVDPEAARKHWAFQPLGTAPPPAVKDAGWCRTGADPFVLAELEKNGLRPSPDADRHTWLRRVSLDLTGLPPTPEEIAAFRDDASESAFETVVDRLLASPAFGERWARPWLDLVGYADQIGSANNVPAEHAWRYRDYVIRSLNADKPFDVFVREQVAGDLREASSIEERQDQLTATGFLVLGNVNIVEADKLVMEMDLVDQQIEKVGKTFLGLTLQCARCHDHKFDPVLLTDYYGLAGIFASTQSTYKEARGVWSSVLKRELPETLSQFTARQEALKDHERKTAALQGERDAVENRLKELEPLIAAARDPQVSRPEGAKPLADLEKEKGDLAGKRDALNRQALHLAYLKPSAPLAFSVKDAKDIADARRQIRGNPHALAEAVPRGFVRAVAPGETPKVPPGQSGRRQLAEWLVGPAGALTARVTVNRFWHKLFGRGIVGSVDYFGLRGDRPSHPELLDALARQFRDGGWSQKGLIRSLVLSRTYRQASGLDDSHRPAMTLDPENRLVWRMTPRRLEAEMLRDSVLAVSGSLQPFSGGQALAPEFPENVGGLSPTDVNPISFSLSRFRDDQSRLRTIYLPVVRSSEQKGPGDILNFFDFTQPGQLSGSRPTTTVAAQSLFLLNGPLLKDASRRLAAQVLSGPGLTSDDARLGAIALRILNRPFSDAEMAEARTFLKDSGPEPAVWERLIHSLLATNEFLFRL